MKEENGKENIEALQLMAGPLAKTAIVRRLAATMTDCVTSKKPAEPINLELARKQQQKYIDVLRENVETVIEVEADDEYPDCCFVEDTVVVVGDTAVMTSMGHASRRGEGQAIENTLRKIATIKRIMHMQMPATVDGGDVLNTGHHLFVGLSNRTNKQGFHFLQEACGTLPVLGIHVPETLHLKCLVTALSPSCLVAADSVLGQAVIEAMTKAAAPFVYEVIFVPSLSAANVLRLPNNTVVVPSASPESGQIIQTAQPHLRLVPLDMSEAQKADGALTCQCVLIN